MKVYIATRFKGSENKKEIEELCAAVKAAGLEDFNFIRDVEHYKHTFDNPKELWQRTHDEINACDALLVDISDHPTGGRLVEAGIAYALKKPVIVIKKPGVEYKTLFDGISSTVIEYKNFKDLTNQLKKYDDNRNFNFTDQVMILVVLLILGFGIGWTVGQLFWPLGFIAAVVYWLAVRRFIPSMRAFDRLVAYIPFAILWVVGFTLLLELNQTFAWAWGIAFWFVVALILKKLKFSL